MTNLLPQYSDLDAPVMQVVVQLPADGVTTEPAQMDSEIVHSRDDLSIFFGIGMTINIVMIIAFVVWAIKQWKKNDTSEK